MAGGRKKIVGKLVEINGKQYIEDKNGVMYPITNGGIPAPSGQMVLPVLQNAENGDVVSEKVIGEIKTGDKFKVVVSIATTKSGKPVVKCQRYSKFHGKDGLQYYRQKNPLNFYNVDSLSKFIEILSKALSEAKDVLPKN